MAVAYRVGQALHEQHAHALAPAGAVGIGGERLAAPVRRQPALLAELDEGARRRHHRRAAGQRQVALAAPQRARRQVQGDQRRRARGVHGDGRALEPVAVGEPPGGDGARAAAEQVALEALRGQVGAGAVVVVHHAREHTGAAAPEGLRVDAGPLERLPRRLQQQPLLGVGGERLARRHAEEGRVEEVGVVQEAALAGVRLADLLRVRVVEALHVPAPVLRELGDGVDAVLDQLPQVLGGGHPARVAAGHADDRDRLLVLALHFPQALAGVPGVGDGPLEVFAEFYLVSHVCSAPGGCVR